MRIKTFKQIAILAIMSLSTSAFAGELGLYLPGISYHIGANNNNPAFEKAPRRLDKNGAFVFNPGVGVGFDFRSPKEKDSFSLNSIYLRFQDCNDKLAQAVGAGPRYRFAVGENFSIDGDLFLALYEAKDWESGKNNRSFVPFPSIGVNYHFEKASIGFKGTFSPRNKAHSSTADFNLLFGYFYIGFDL